MCERFTQSDSWQKIHEFYGLAGQPQNLQPNYNVAPTQTVYVIVAGNAGLGLQDMRWGLVPTWWKGPLEDLPSAFNARAETAAKKPMFRAAFKRYRCLVPASGFYEWKRSGDTKQPYHIAMTDGSPMTFAGLWEPWTDPETDEDRPSCTILTTRPNRFMEAIHNRMPVVLEPDQFDDWLSSGTADVLRPCHRELLAAHPVDPKVEDVRNNGPELMKPIC